MVNVQWAVLEHIEANELSPYCCRSARRACGHNTMVNVEWAVLSHVEADERAHAVADEHGGCPRAELGQEVENQVAPQVQCVAQQGLVAARKAQEVQRQHLGDSIRHGVAVWYRGMFQARHSASV